MGVFDVGSPSDGRRGGGQSHLFYETSHGKCKETIWATLTPPTSGMMPIAPVTSSGSSNAAHEGEGSSQSRVAADTAEEADREA